MNIIIRILLGALTGWLTGKAADGEDTAHITKRRHVLDVACGIVGAFIGEYLFFWIVFKESDSFTHYMTAVLGSITVVGAARLVADRANRIKDGAMP